MSRLPFQQILVAVCRVGAAAAFVLAVAGCGQKGALFLSRDPAAAQRAPLPAAIGSTLPDFGGYQDRDSPAPALPSVPAAVVAPTPAASNTAVPTDSRQRLP